MPRELDGSCFALGEGELHRGGDTRVGPEKKLMAGGKEEEGVPGKGLEKRNGGNMLMGLGKQLSSVWPEHGGRKWEIPHQTPPPPLLQDIEFQPNWGAFRGQESDWFRTHSLRLDCQSLTPGPTSYQLCDLRQLTEPLCAIVPSSVT